MNRVRLCFALLFLIPSWLFAKSAAPMALFVDGKSPQAMFAAEDIQSSLKQKGHDVKQFSLAQLDRRTEGTRIILVPRSNAEAVRQMQSEGARPPGTLKSEGYSLRVSSKAGRSMYWVVGADAAGVMYGGLELAEVRPA